MKRKGGEKEQQKEQQKELNEKHSQKKQKQPLQELPKSQWKPDPPTKHREFGGPIGCFLIFVFSHFIVYYLWVSLTFNGGAFFIPSSETGGWGGWASKMLHHITVDAAPSWFAVKIYWGFLIIQAFLSMVIPGIRIKGLPIPSEGNRRLEYNCNGIYAWYISLALAAVAHYQNWFKLTAIIDHIGPLATVAMISSDILAVLSYVMSHIQGVANRATGNVMYDFFIGTYLNPRFLNLDLKMWGEIRVAWIMLFFLTLSAAVKQYEEIGYLTTPMIFMLLAHGLYTNACMKGEECIPTTWDIFHEQWGWMLIYWNFCGVPFVYCSQSMYIMRNGVEGYHPYLNYALFVVLLIAYYIWDTSQSQRNRFRMMDNGSYVKRWAFPQLPWGTLHNPKYLTTACGSKLLIDGWWQYARKIHYTCDVVMALCWGLCCGFDHLLPYFYFFFFLGMILHRAARDDLKCATKYGKDWEMYCKKIPYLYVPGVY